MIDPCAHSFNISRFFLWCKTIEKRLVKSANYWASYIACETVVLNFPGQMDNFLVSKSRWLCGYYDKAVRTKVSGALSETRTHTPNQKAREIFEQSSESLAIDIRALQMLAKTVNPVCNSLVQKQKVNIKVLSLR